jgi:hypothetical protein
VPTWAALLQMCAYARINLLCLLLACMFAIAITHFFNAGFIYLFIQYRV